MDIAFFWLCWVFIAACEVLIVMCRLSSSSVGASLMVHRLSFPVAYRKTGSCPSLNHVDIGLPRWC